MNLTGAMLSLIAATPNHYHEKTFGDACEKPVMAMLALDFHPAVGDEIAEAIEWYRERSEAAADEFIVALDEALNQIAADPGRAALYMHGRRAVRVGKFPYVVIYRPHELSVRISAVAHTSRRPGYWRHRRF